jgi:two-component system response regulator (stage 0 sporulation protein A)
MKPRRDRIEDKLLALGVRPNLLGFGCLVDAVEIWMERGRSREITKVLYPEIADRRGTTGSRVERAIRHAIEMAADCCGYEDMMEILGTTTTPEKGKLTNGEFIATLALLVAREERAETE